MANLDSSKVYKIKYSINLLPQIGAHIDIQQGDDGRYEKRLLNDNIGWMNLL